VVEAGARWAGILFSENGELILGPEAGRQHAGSRVQVPVVFDGERIAELVVDGPEDRAFLEAVAEVIAPYCLVGWDTGGVAWDPEN
jgi:putative methionine-R-sulfoxide reductase with GAF domain